jgi:hypothetical protein
MRNDANTVGRVTRIQVRGTAIVLALATALLAGCASMRPAPPTPITSMSEIEGKWRGTITIGFGGPEVLYYLTIHPNGQYVAEWGISTQWGRVTLSGGGASFQAEAGVMGASSGTITYSPSPRSLSLNSTFGNWSAYVTPLN